MMLYKTLLVCSSVVTFVFPNVLLDPAEPVRYPGVDPGLIGVGTTLSPTDKPSNKESLIMKLCQLLPIKKALCSVLPRGPLTFL